MNNWHLKYSTVYQKVITLFISLWKNVWYNLNEVKMRKKMFFVNSLILMLHGTQNVKYV